MRLTIQRRVFLATLVLATVLVLLLALVMRWNLVQGFERYTTAAESARLDGLIRNLESEYALHGNWDFVRADPERVWRRLSRLGPEGGPGAPPGPPAGPPRGAGGPGDAPPRPGDRPPQGDAPPPFGAEAGAGPRPR